TDVDVSGRAEVVAGDQDGVERAGALVGNPRPDRTAEDDRVPAIAAVARRNDVAGTRTPGGYDSINRFRGQRRAVSENDDGGTRGRRRRRRAAARRGPWAAPPLGAPTDVGVGLALVRPDDDDDLADRAGRREPFQPRLEQHPLLRRAETGRRPR